MGNRILKGSITTSPEIDALSWFEEVFFYRLIVSADDYGVFPANPVLLAHLLFPMKENVTRGMTEQALDTLERLGLIRRYRAERGVFLQLVTWEKHQRLRNTRRIYPAPGEAFPDETHTDEAFPDQTFPDQAAVCGASGKKEIPARNRDLENRTEPAVETAEPENREPPVVALPLNDGSEYPVTRREAEEYAALYPAADVEQELRAMRGWCLSNESRRKTRSGIRRFINSWMARAQDRGGTPNDSRRAPPVVRDVSVLPEGPEPENHGAALAHRVPERALPGGGAGPDGVLRRGHEGFPAGPRRAERDHLFPLRAGSAFGYGGLAPDAAGHQPGHLLQRGRV